MLSAAARMVESRLLKSCAIPPAIWPIACILRPSEISVSRRASLAMSVMRSNKPSMAPSSPGNGVIDRVTRRPAAPSRPNRCRRSGVASVSPRAPARTRFFTVSCCSAANRPTADWPASARDGSVVMARKVALARTIRPDGSITSRPAPRSSNNRAATLSSGSANRSIGRRSPPRPRFRCAGRSAVTAQPRGFCCLGRGARHRR